MVDHHLDDRNWAAPLDQEVPHTSGVGATTYVIVALIIAAVAAFWLWDGTGISAQTYSGPQESPIPMDNPVQPLKSQKS
jgi:hypothetical protein